MLLKFCDTPKIKIVISLEWQKKNRELTKICSEKFRAVLYMVLKYITKNTKKFLNEYCNLNIDSVS